MHTTATKTTAHKDDTQTGGERSVPLVHTSPEKPPLWSQTGLPIQTRLTINQPGDKYEQEADRVAEQVMRMPEPDVQRKNCSCGKPAGSDGMCAECKKKELGVQRLASSDIPQTAAPPIVHQVLQQPGRPLDGATRNFMEARFGHDFSQVQVHAGKQAVEAAHAVKARAFTMGHDIVFGAGEYAPGSQSGQRLLAHELTHVLQQQRRIQRMMPASGPELASDGDVPVLTSELPDFPLKDRVYESPGASLILQELYFAWAYWNEDPGAAVEALAQAERDLQEGGDVVAANEVGPGAPDFAFEARPELQELFGQTTEVAAQIWGLLREGGGTDRDILRPVLDNVGKLIRAYDPYWLSYEWEPGKSSPDLIQIALESLDEFVRGFIDGLGQGSDAAAVALLRTHAQHAVSGIAFAFANLILVVGMLAGIGEMIGTFLAELHKIAENPSAVIEDAKKAIRAIFTTPVPELANSLGMATGEAVRTEVDFLAKQSNPLDYFFHLGRLMGPVVLDIIIGILFEVYVLPRILGYGGRALAAVLERLPDIDVLKKRHSHKPDVAPDDLKSVTPISETSKLMGLSVEINFGDQLGVHKLSLAEKGGKLIVRVCSDPDCGEFIKRIQQAIKQAGPDTPTNVYQELLEEALRLNNYWNGLGEQEAKNHLEKLKKSFERAHAEAPDTTRAVVESEGTIPPHIRGFRISEERFMDFESVVGAMYPDRQFSGIKSKTDHGNVLKPSIIEELKSVGEKNPAEWKSVHYVVEFIDRSEEEFSVFEVDRFRQKEYRGPHP